MKKEYSNEISEAFLDCVKRTVARVSGEDGNHRPFHSSLLSPEALFWSRFERSFSTSFGQGVIEKISKIAALSGGATKANNQVHTHVKIDENKLNAINTHISALRNTSRGSWNNDLNEILSTPDNGNNIKERVISDLVWVKNGTTNYMSIKTVKPNIDQTAEAKKDLLKLKINDPSCNVYFGLYYNPFSENKADYTWSPPQKIFDFQNDPCVLIGREYWDTLGGNGFYDELLAIVRSVGDQAKSMITF